MSSSDTSPLRRLYEKALERTRPLLSRMGGYRHVYGALAKSRGRYLNAEILGEVIGCSVEEAERELAHAVERGLLEVRYIFLSPDYPIEIVINKHDIGETITLGEAGVGGDDPSQELELSKLFTREIFVASR